MRFSYLVILLLCPLLAVLPAAADDDHLDARALSSTGTIMPLDQLLPLVQRHHPGRVIEVELERRGDGYRYELELLDEKGEVWELEFDAASGELLQRERED